jgi:hypothetical protein
VADHAAGKPIMPAPQRLIPRLAADRSRALTRRAWWMFVICTLSIWAPLLTVALYSQWTTWIALAIAMALVPFFARQMGQLGWEQRDLDEQIRTMGTWRVTGVDPQTRGPVILSGFMVHGSHDQVGSLHRPIYVDLDATD